MWIIQRVMIVHHYNDEVVDYRRSQITQKSMVLQRRGRTSLQMLKTRFANPQHQSATRKKTKLFSLSDSKKRPSTSFKFQRPSRCFSQLDVLSISRAKSLRTSASTGRRFGPCCRVGNLKSLPICRGKSRGCDHSRSRTLRLGQ